MKHPTIQKNTVRVVTLLACFSLAISAKAQVFTIFGNQLVANLSTINGNVGISPGGNLDLTAPATINGDLYLDTTATLTQDGVINGATFDNQSLGALQNSLFSTSATIAGLTPNQTLTGLQTGALNFNVASGNQEVVNLPDGLALDNQNITLTGAGRLVLNIGSSFSLAGSASIIGDPANIIVNYTGSSTVTSDVGSSVNGTVFLTGAAADLSGTWTGIVYGGGDTITLDSGAVLNPVPEPGSMALAALGGISMNILRRRFFGLKCSA